MGGDGRGSGLSGHHKQYLPYYCMRKNHEMFDYERVPHGILLGLFDSIWDKKISIFNYFDVILVLNDKN